MLRAISDENFDGNVLRGLLRRNPNIDLVRVQDAGLSGIYDPELLDWCAAANRVLFTYDRRTMPRFAYKKVRAGLPMAGVFVVDLRAPTRAVISELLELIEKSEPDAWKDQVLFINPSMR